jgi:hypothetical protein
VNTKLPEWWEFVFFDGRSAPHRIEQLRRTGTREVGGTTGGGRRTRRAAAVAALARLRTYAYMYAGLVWSGRVPHPSVCLNVCIASTAPSGSNGK